ncbi:uncharacterized protein HaLaN_22783 [Haematococcus lacustris]|uniref:Uncharacterized protein n=1 Tax=Haematococcus lacustris TaxID=44745 RepID=A0A6A0A0I8_HAELA|nr:uncharacterized protein HaLaN_22783 [Haematococcus lacustris]
MSNPTANFAPFESKCRSAGLTEAAIAAFRHNYEQLAAGATGLLEALVPPGEEPSLLQASALTVKGPVKFTKGRAVLRVVAVALPDLWRTRKQLHQAAKASNGELEKLLVAQGVI